MPTSFRLAPQPTAVRFDDAQMWVDLDDGRNLGVPLVWFPRLLHASPELRGKFFLSPDGIHWEELDEDISIASLLAGRGDRSQVQGGFDQRHKADAGGC